MIRPKRKVGCAKVYFPSGKKKKLGGKIVVILSYIVSCIQSYYANYFNLCITRPLNRMNCKFNVH